MAEKHSLRTVLYTRVSTNKEEQKQSLDNQKAIYTDYCKANNFELVDIYHDSKTGTNARRPGFKKMMLDAGLDYVPDDKNVDSFIWSDREPIFDLIIVKDTTRFSRNAEIAESVVKRLLDKNVDILFENVNLRASDENFKLVGSFLFKMGENESSMMGKKIRQTKQYKARVKQQYKPARLPYGYTWNEKREIVKVPEQAEIVEYIFNSYHEKGGMLLTKELNEKNVPTQRNHKWSGDKVTRIIKNLIYTGTAVTNRTHKKNVTDTKRLPNVESDYIYIYNAVPPIISLKQYEEANKIRESRISEFKNKKRGRKVTYNDIYFQKVQCGICNKRFHKHSTAGTGNNKKITYMCSSRSKQGRCGCRSVSLNILNKGLEEITFNLIGESMREIVQYQTLMKRIKIELSCLEQSRNQIQSQIDQLSNDSERFLDKIDDYSEKGEEKLAKGFEIKYKNTTQKIEALELQLAETSVEKILELRFKIEKKKGLIEELKLNQLFTNEEKLKLLKKIIVTNYELEYFFTIPNFDDEIKEFNETFKDNAIKDSLQPITSGFIVRRNHKEAREYFAQLKENDETIDQYENNYSIQNAEMVLFPYYKE